LKTTILRSTHTTERYYLLPDRSAVPGPPALDSRYDSTILD